MTRTYTMTARARSVEQTRTKILDATVGLHFERPAVEISLDDVAERAGTSVQTILRHFKTREGLLEASFAHGRRLLDEERRAPVGDLAAAVEAVIAHYEARGDGVLVFLAQEKTNELARKVTDEGRRTHRAWVKEVFAPYLKGRKDADHLVDLAVVATDLYTWKLLRRDRGHSRAKTEALMKRLLLAVLRDGMEVDDG